MNRRLIIMRHAKSSHADARLTDHQRPLNQRGRREAPEIARRLVELGWIPTHVVSSDSTRTRETWEVMQSAFPEAPALRFDENLYLAGASEICDALADVPDEATTVLVLGHNPGWERSIAYFSGEHHRMTTSNAALLESEGDSWEETATSGAFRLVDLLRPRSR